MLRKGYTNTGLSEILSSCQVPKGSFYYYFKSKEDFALQIIEHFDQHYVFVLDQALADASVSPLARIEQKIADGIAAAAAQHCSKGCLIANLCQEMADQNDLLRERLAEIQIQRRLKFASCFAEALSQGQIADTLDPLELAEFFLCGWEGALLRAKATRDTQPLMAFRHLFFAVIAP